jgi:HSP20 family molecular chaperone IbpA
MNNELVPQNDPERMVPATSEAPEQRLLFTPPIDIYESEEGLVLVADLPGVTLENLELQVQDNKLTLFGRVNRYVPEGMLGQHEEYGVGDFLRSFILSDEVDHERINAKLNNGVLKVVLPKVERTEPRKINIDEGE